MADGSLADRFRSGLETRDDLRPEPSRFGEGMAWWCGRHEIVHFHDDHEIDLRLTSAEIRSRRAAFEADPNIVMRPSRSDWVAVQFTSDGDLHAALALVDVAIAASRAAGSRT